MEEKVPSAPGDGRILYAAFALTLAIVPVIAFVSPRSLSFLPGIIGVAFAGLFWAMIRIRPLPGRRTAWGVILLLALAGASSLWALDPEFALARTGKLALILVPGLALAGIAETIDVCRLRPWLKLASYACIAAAGLMALDMILGFPLGRLIHGVGYSDYFQHSLRNRSVIAILAMSFTVYAFVLADKKQRSLFMQALALPFLALTFLTDSQSAQIGMVMALLCFFFFPYSHKGAWYAMAVILAGGTLLAPVIAIWMFDHLAAAILDAPLLGAGSGFGSQRLEIWDAVARKALESPLWGFGIEATRAVEAFDTAQIYRQGATELHPHNFALQLWIEFGVAGAFVGAGFFLTLFHALSRCGYEAARVALPTFMFMLPVLSFGYGMWQSWLVGLLVLVFAFVRLAMRLYEKI